MEGQLENFSGWDETKIPSDFFNDSPEDLERKEDEPVEEKPKGKLKNKEVEEEDDEPELTADDIFSDSEDEEEEEDIPVKTPGAKQKKANPSSLSSAVSLLKERGIIDYELEDGEELTEELADEILEDKYEESVDNRIEELFSELPDVVKQINKYAMQGGDLDKFFATMSKQNIKGISYDMDMGDEDNQELVVKTMLEKEGYDEDYIETQIEFLKDSNKLKSIAEKKHDLWKTKNKKEQERILASQAEEVERHRESVKKEKTRLYNTLEELDDVQGIKLSKQDKKDLPSYILDRNIRLNNGGTISAIHKDIYDVMNNETAVIQLAKLLKTRNKDGSFNFKEIEAVGKTKLTQEVRDNVRRNKTITPTKSAGRDGSSQTKSLADYF